LEAYLVLGITFGFTAAVQPGPLQTFIISRTLQGGWRQTLPAACAPLFSDIPIILLVLLILNNIPAWVEQFLHLAGGLFVLFLAWGAYRSYRRYNLNQVISTDSAGQNLFKATIVNLLNPNPYLSWSLVLGPLLLEGWREAPSHGVALAAGFYFMMIFINGVIIVLFSPLRKFGPRVNRTLIGVSAVALAGFGIYQLWLGASALWFK
jgi:threonine/homoserine/homoserine lactone efflux protein